MDVQLGAASRAGLLEKILDAQRRRLFDAFMCFKQDNDSDSVLDVEAGSALQQDASYLLAWSDTRQRARITSCAIEPALGGCSRHGNDAQHATPKAALADRMKYRRADGRLLPFADGEFDWLFCADLIAPAGGAVWQYELLSELAPDRIPYRVAADALAACAGLARFAQTVRQRRVGLGNGIEFTGCARLERFGRASARQAARRSRAYPAGRNQGAFFSADSKRCASRTEKSRIVSTERLANKHPAGANAGRVFVRAIGNESGVVCASRFTEHARRNDEPENQRISFCCRLTPSFAAPV